VVLVLVIVILCNALAPAALAQLAVETSPSKILRHPERYNEQAIRIEGKVVRGRPWTSPRGHERFIFYLSDDRMAIAVVVSGGEPCPAGSIATVEGTFYNREVIDGRLVYNHIKADVVRCAGPGPTE
jgi:hypothetical protein